MAKGRSILLFDLDDTLTKAYQEIAPEMKECLSECLERGFSLGVVSGSDFSKIERQIGREFLKNFEYVFAENGTQAYHQGVLIHSESIVNFLPNSLLNEFFNFCLHYIADLDIPVKRMAPPSPGITIDIKQDIPSEHGDGPTTYYGGSINKVKLTKVEDPPGSGFVKLTHVASNGGLFTVEKVLFGSTPVSDIGAKEPINSLAVWYWSGDSGHNQPLFIEIQGKDKYERHETKGNGSWNPHNNGSQTTKRLEGRSLENILDLLNCQLNKAVTLNLTFQNSENKSGKKYCCGYHNPKGQGNITVKKEKVRCTLNHNSADYYEHEITNGSTLSGIRYDVSYYDRRRIKPSKLQFPIQDPVTVYALYCDKNPKLIYIKDGRQDGITGWYKKPNSSGRDKNEDWTDVTHALGDITPNYFGRLECNQWNALVKELKKDGGCTKLEECPTPPPKPPGPGGFCPGEPAVPGSLVINCGPEGISAVLSAEPEDIAKEPTGTNSEGGGKGDRGTGDGPGASASGDNEKGSYYEYEYSGEYSEDESRAAVADGSSRSEPVALQTTPPTGSPDTGQQPLTAPKERLVAVAPLTVGTIAGYFFAGTAGSGATFFGGWKLYNKGCFTECRKAVINISPIGRSCSFNERVEFNELDSRLKIREKMVKALEERFSGCEPPLQFSVGGKISFDCFPKGWSKVYALKFLDFEEIHFFGDMTHPGGNDHELFVHEKVTGHRVTNSQDTLTQLKTILNYTS
ncbi:phosphomannomutase, putative [Theileria equi strain WA]|uniref:Phosphomannomutase n=1 Tax=Theileria equi strain WA TaxID=1537102 RepID=L1LFC4_THEEQ|nr:phosphomannomutase, putative [Theileria equi strain WA]EKX73848.1 phosphomannomutase, putative [Theileria equi strain WA]|eukprot:XP_004833300.1 phosphomannomutase, putative [Theileria equi strain WA]